MTTRKAKGRKVWKIDMGILILWVFKLVWFYVEEVVRSVLCSSGGWWEARGRGGRSLKGLCGNGGHLRLHMLLAPMFFIHLCTEISLMQFFTHLICIWFVFVISSVAYGQSLLCCIGQLSPYKFNNADMWMNVTVNKYGNFPQKGKSLSK